MTADLRPVAPSQGRLKVTFWLDAALLVSVCALQTVPSTGLVVHEWLGLAMVAMVLAHLLFSWSWIASLSRRLLAPQPVRTRVNYVLNLMLFGCMTAVIFSGILISQRAIPALLGAGATSNLDWRWDSLHILSSQIVLLLAGLHVAVNWDWVVAAGLTIFRRVLGGEAAR